MQLTRTYLNKALEIAVYEFDAEEECKGQVAVSYTWDDDADKEDWHYVREENNNVPAGVSLNSWDIYWTNNRKLSVDEMMNRGPQFKERLLILIALDLGSL